MTKNEKIRLAIFAVIPIIFAVSLAHMNPRFTFATAAGYPMPFLLMGLAMATLMGVLILQAPGPPEGVPVRKFWLWVDPLVALLILMKLASGWLFFIMYGETSGWYGTPELWWQIPRVVMLVVGYTATVVGIELLVRTAIARRKGHTKEVEVYGKEHVEDEVGD